MPPEPNEKNFKKRLLKIARFILIAGLVIACLFIFFNYLIGWLLPFITAWIIAFMIQPVVKFLNEKLKLPRKLATILFLLFLFAALGFVIFFAVDRIIYELTLLSQNFSLTDSTTKILDFINGIFAQLEGFLGNIPFFSDGNMIEDIKEILNTEIGAALTQFGADVLAQIPSFIKSIAIAIPKTLIFTLITIVSTFYISLDFNNINKFISIQFPPKTRNIMLDIKSRFLEAIYKYIKAYSIIYLITYSELTVGFLIIGIKYAFVIALIVALIDILPVLGTGAVLIPWGIISLTQKDYFTGFALLILYAVIVIIRNIIEPKIVGANIGLYPVITLITMYVGYNIFGMAGIFLLPIGILILKNLNDEGKIHLWKNLKKDDGDKKNEKNDDEKHM